VVSYDGIHDKKKEDGRSKGKYSFHCRPQHSPIKICEEALKARKEKKTETVEITLIILVIQPPGETSLALTYADRLETLHWGENIEKNLEGKNHVKT